MKRTGDRHLPIGALSRGKRAGWETCREGEARWSKVKLDACTIVRMFLLMVSSTLSRHEAEITGRVIAESIVGYVDTCTMLLGISSS